MYLFINKSQNSLIKFCIIADNKKNGIKCKGEKNKSRIINNSFIGLNHKSGIKMK